MKKLINNLGYIFVILFIVSCNNKQEGNLDEDDQDIRIEGYEKNTATDNAYPNNAVGEYLNYISEGEWESNPSAEKSLKLLAAAIVEKNEEANISSNSELRRLATLDLSKEYQISQKDFTTAANALQNGIDQGAFVGGGNMEDLKNSSEAINIEENRMGKEMKDFFETAAKLLEAMKVKGSS